MTRRTMDELEGTGQTATIEQQQPTLHRPTWPKWIMRTLDRMHHGRRRAQQQQQHQQHQQRQQQHQQHHHQPRSLPLETLQPDMEQDGVAEKDYRKHGGHEPSSSRQGKATLARSQPTYKERESAPVRSSNSKDLAQTSSSSPSRPGPPDSVYSTNGSFSTSPTPSSYGFHARSYTESGVVVPSAISEQSSLSQGADEDASIRPISPHSHDEGSRRFANGTVPSIGGGSLTKSIYPQEPHLPSSDTTRQRASSRGSYYHPLTTWQIKSDNCSDYTASISILESDSIGEGSHHRRTESLNGGDNASMVTLAPSSKMRWPFSQRDSIDTHASTRAIAPSRRGSADSGLSALRKAPSVR